MSTVPPIRSESRTFPRQIAPKRIAEDLAKAHAEILCENCQFRREPSAEEFLDYMLHSWPVCCGQTLMLVLK